MKKEVSSKIAYLTFGILIICFAIASFAIAWTEPGSSPPGGNVATPLNVSNAGQSKAGGLVLNTGGATDGLIIARGNLRMNGVSGTNGIIFPDGTLQTKAVTSLQCVTVRIYESTSIPIAIVYYTGSNPGSVNNIATRNDRSNNPLGSNDSFGLICTQANGWIMTGCAHMAFGGGSSDSYMRSNGCYGGDDDGSADTNIIDTVCCRLVD